jgi:hypothetical protein
MSRRVRLAVLALAALAALAVAGCGNKTETAIVADTEGIYVGVDQLTYQIQLSRILNPHDIEDQAYLRGVPVAEREPAPDEVWFGVFMRVENLTDGSLTPTDGFKITDTQGAEFEPVTLDPALNVFSYQPRPIAPAHLLPALNSPPSDNTIQGALILFKLKIASLYNRPLEFEIQSQKGGDNAVIDLDV